MFAKRACLAAWRYELGHFDLAEAAALVACAHHAGLAIDRARGLLQAGQNLAVV